MATTYPGTIQTITDYAGTVTLAAADHANWHATTSDTVEGLENVVGTTAGTSVLKNFAAGDFPARINSSNVLQQALSGTLNNSVVGTPSVTGGTIATSVITSPTIGTPVINVGSDATGDTYYRNSGALTRLAIGAANTYLKSDGTTPSWASLLNIKQIVISANLGGTSTATQDTYIHWAQATITPQSASGTIYVFASFNGINNEGAVGGRKGVLMRYNGTSGGTTGTDIGAENLVNSGTFATQGLQSMTTFGAFSPGTTAAIYVKALAIKRDNTTGTAYWGNYNCDSRIVLLEVA